MGGERKTVQEKSAKHPQPSKDIKDFTQYIPGRNKMLKYQAKKLIMMQKKHKYEN